MAGDATLRYGALVSGMTEDGSNRMNGMTGRRKVVQVGKSAFLAYDLEGPVQPDISWLPVSYDRASGNGCHVMRL